MKKYVCLFIKLDLHINKTILKISFWDSPPIKVASMKEISDSQPMHHELFSGTSRLIRELKKIIYKSAQKLFTIPLSNNIVKRRIEDLAINIAKILASHIK